MPHPLSPPAPFAVMAKPIGPVCNLDCSYCYYIRKPELYDPVDPRAVMREEVLEAYIQDYLRADPSANLTFVWQGGEPTLLGLDWFRGMRALQRKHLPPGRTIENALQTNGTGLDDEWARFLREEDFLVGLSLDGPEAIHDGFRLDKGGKSSFARVMQGLGALHRHGVRFNTLTTIHRKNQKQGRAVYDFLVKEAGSRHLQFIPIVERRLADGRDPGPPALDRIETRAVELSPETVGPNGYGMFLGEVFDAWLARDVGRVFVYAVEQVLSRLIDGHAGICVHEETCGRAVVLERDGGVYSCDHYVYPEYRLGMLGDQGLAGLMGLERQQQFGRDKRDRLPAQCRTCPVLAFCNGGCPKHRFAVTVDGQPGLNHLCPSYLRFFTKVRGPLTELAGLIQAGKDPALLMKTRR